jgi:hypothetical protein
LGTYLESNGSQLFYEPSVIPDTTNSHTYFLDSYGKYSQYQAVNIDVYDQASYTLLGTVPFTSIYPPNVTDLVRGGSNEFAFRCVHITGAEPSANQIVFVTSNLIAPNNVTPVPILSSVSPAQVNAGGQAFSMQLTAAASQALPRYWSMAIRGRPLMSAALHTHHRCRLPTSLTLANSMCK